MYEDNPRQSQLDADAAMVIIAIGVLVVGGTLLGGTAWILWSVL